MKRVLTIELDYDAPIMYGDDPEAKEWFEKEVLGGPLILHSNELGDGVGVCRVIYQPQDTVREALEQIAKQKLASEVSEEDREYADYESGYDCIVRIARTALTHPQPEAREEDKAKCPESDPVTGAPYFMDIEHPTRGLVPTYGGPFESYTLCERDMDESDKDTVRFIREVFDHDEGAWTDIIEPVHVVAITEARLDKLEEDSEALSRIAAKEGATCNDPLPVAQSEGNHPGSPDSSRVRGCETCRRWVVACDCQLSHPDEDRCKRDGFFYYQPAAPATSEKPEEGK